MTAPNGYTPEDLSGANVVDAEGNKVGAVQKVYRDDTTGEPEWVTVRTGLFGTKETFVPLAGSTRTDSGLRVPHSKDLIKDAPRIDVDGHLDRSEEGELYRHYGLSGPGDTGRLSGNGAAGRTTQTTQTTQTTSTGRHAAGAAGAAAAGTAATGTAAAAASGAADRGRTTARPLADTMSDGTGGRTLAGAGARSAAGADGVKGQTEELLLSEERLSFATEEREAGRAQLRKRVVTEDVTKSVAVSHEEVRVTRVPITDEERRAGRTAAQIGEGQVEVVLHEERAVMRKETVPVERVRLEVYKVTEQKEMTGQVRKEEVDFNDGVRAKYADGDLGGPTTKR
ncbi:MULTISPECIES: PRC and DUF2382 domain-containing protein [Streptomyces]|uniref:PRC and DUF2382 domain-containing protein n=1 Tax=Streptomyces cremeus TaxID=66881 RepID=A0ABV5P8R9_STRCM